MKKRIIKKVTELIIFKRDFLEDSQKLFQQLRQNVKWDESIISRKTVCFGEPYDYSEQNYEFQPMSKDM